MKRSYLLKWFDDVISDTLNPSTLKSDSISRVLAEHLMQSAEKEKKQILTELCFSFFGIKKEEAIRLQARNYYSILLLLIDTCGEYEANQIINESRTLHALLSKLKSSLQEILEFITLRFSFYIPKQVKENPYSVTKSIEPPTKVSVRMSVDQLSLIVRAAFENDVFLTKSMNELYKSISPYLSTPKTTNISSKSMRSKAYSAETGDKEKAIAILNSLIESIKDY